ncbi:sulfatase [Halalkalibaculum sp. DA384]|uniref:sulfatase family protein n=1 Tax=Halalkalibaculum sp. DA384 TaxID=3373606 RepID=UPI003755284F
MICDVSRASYKRIFMLTLFLIACVLFSGISQTVKIEDKSQSDQKPNIIVMYSDDHTAQAVGAYQGELNYGLRLDHSPTPNIDRLADNGMRFDKAFVTNSICKPSRAVLLTGLLSHLNGVPTNAESISTDIETFPKLLKRSGYQTSMIGKWHLGTEPQGFDYYEVLYGQGPYYNPIMRTPNGDVDRQGHTSEVITESALRWLKKKRNQGQSFMMMYNHKAPHSNWLPGPDHLDDYRDRKIPEPPTFSTDFSGLSTAPVKADSGMSIKDVLTWGRLTVPLHPETGERHEHWLWQVENNRLTKEQLERINEAYEEGNEYLYQNYVQMTEKERERWKYQRYVKNYLRVVRGIDDGVGRIMAYLQRENLIENTVVIYAGDQGFFLGENGWYDKRFIYEESLRMPLIFHWPKGIKPGSVNKQLVQNLDLAPTILDLADVVIPDHMQGRSIVPLLKGEKPADWRDAAYYHYFEGQPMEDVHSHYVEQHYGVRTDQYTLVHYPRIDEWELFDLESEPEQIQSVYGEQEYSDEQKRLKGKLKNLQSQYGDNYWQSDPDEYWE